VLMTRVSGLTVVNKQCSHHTKVGKVVTSCLLSLWAGSAAVVACGQDRHCWALRHLAKLLTMCACIQTVDLSLAGSGMRNDLQDDVFSFTMVYGT
jgi:hypothetical protein